MELSPLEISSQKFSTRIKGYDIAEVDNFLKLVSSDLETLYGEYYNLKEEIVKKNREIEDYKEKDKSISEAVMMVQSVANDIKQSAIKEADAIKKIAVSEAASILKDANEKYRDIIKNIDELLNKRLIIINSVKNLLSDNSALIEREASRNMEVPVFPEFNRANETAGHKGTAPSLGDVLTGTDTNENANVAAITVPEPEEAGSSTGNAENNGVTAETQNAG